MVRDLRCRMEELEEYERSDTAANNPTRHNTEPTRPVFVLWRIGAATGDLSALRAAEIALRAALKEHTRDHARWTGQASKIILARCFRKSERRPGTPGLRGPRPPSAPRSRRSPATARDGLGRHETQSWPRVSKIGTGDGDLSALHAAETAYHDALGEQPATARDGLAGTHHDLGIVLSRIGGATGTCDPARRRDRPPRRAQGAYSDRTPKLWANTEVLLATCSARWNGDRVLRPARYGDRLPRPRSRSPPATAGQWTRQAQNNLGGVLLRIEAATGTFRPCAPPRSPSAPRSRSTPRSRANESAGTQNNLGVVLLRIGEATGTLRPCDPPRPPAAPRSRSAPATARRWTGRHETQSWPGAFAYRRATAPCGLRRRHRPPRRARGAHPRPRADGLARHEHNLGLVLSKSGLAAGDLSALTPPRPPTAPRSGAHPRPRAIGRAELQKYVVTVSISAVGFWREAVKQLGHSLDGGCQGRSRCAESIDLAGMLSGSPHRRSPCSRD